MMELEVERMVHGGYGLGRLPSGKVALIRGAIPGETVRTELVESAGVLRGTAAEVLEASPDRIPAPTHPGLDYGHIDYRRQLALKQEVVLDALRRALRDDPPELPPVVAAPSIWEYRTAVQPAVSRRMLGYRTVGGSDIVTLPRDPVAIPAINSTWEQLLSLGLPKGVREVTMRGNHLGETLLAFIASSPQRALLPFAHELVRKGAAVGVSYAPYDARGRFRGGSERLAGSRQVRQRYGDLELSVTATSFAQPNPEAAGLLIGELLALAGRGGTAVELFAGSGAISLHLASSYREVIALEIDRASVARGEADARRLGIDNVQFVGGDARKVEVPTGTELLVVDPPRAGLAKEVKAAIDESPAGRLLYVSCDPATWARDVAQLQERGWRLESARPYDFYPHTHHVELLSLLVR